MELEPLSGEQLQATLMRMRSALAPGCDSWRVDELKRLPLLFFDRLAYMLNIVEDTGLWPDALCESVVSLISNKGEGTSPLKLRPIGVMSVVYRLWAATRVRQVMSWQETWIDKACIVSAGTPDKLGHDATTTFERTTLIRPRWEAKGYSSPVIPPRRLDKGHNQAIGQGKQAHGTCTTRLF